jgi:hypothetical protein
MIKSLQNASGDPPTSLSLPRFIVATSLNWTQMMVDEYILRDRTLHLVHVVRRSFDLMLRIVDVDSYTEGTYRG